MMAVYSCIYREIWNDDEFLELSDDAQFAFLHLLTTTFGTQFGFFKAGIASLAEEKRWEVSRYKQAIQEAIEVGFCEYDPKRLLWLIPSYPKRNRPGSINVIKAWGKRWAELPSCELKVRSYYNLKSVFEETGGTFIQIFNEAFELPSVKPSSVPNGVATGIHVDSQSTVDEKNNDNSGFLPSGMPTGMPLEPYSGSESDSSSKSDREKAPAPEDTKTNKQRTIPSQQWESLDGSPGPESPETLKLAEAITSSFPGVTCDPGLLAAELRSRHSELDLLDLVKRAGVAWRANGKQLVKLHGHLDRWCFNEKPTQEAEGDGNYPPVDYIWTASNLRMFQGETAITAYEREKEQGAPQEKLDRWKAEIEEHYGTRLD